LHGCELLNITEDVLHALYNILHYSLICLCHKDGGCVYCQEFKNLLLVILEDALHDVLKDEVKDEAKEIHVLFFHDIVVVDLQDPLLHLLRFDKNIVTLMAVFNMIITISNTCPIQKLVAGW